MSTLYQKSVATRVLTHGPKVNNRVALSKCALIDMLESKKTKLQTSLSDAERALERALRMQNIERIAQLNASIQKKKELIRAMTSTIIRQNELLRK